MNEEVIFEVINKLIGYIEPAADSSIDAVRFNNMKTFIEVFRKMHHVIDDIAYRHENSTYASAKKIGMLCSKQIDSMEIVE